MLIIFVYQGSSSKLLAPVGREEYSVIGGHNEPQQSKDMLSAARNGKIANPFN